MEAQAGFLRKARESLQAAALLTHEGLHDFAVSRAYYAMFYSSAALLSHHGHSSFSRRSAVQSAFGRPLAKPGLVTTPL